MAWLARWLGGGPGVHSKRLEEGWAGEAQRDQEILEGVKRWRHDGSGWPAIRAYLP